MTYEELKHELLYKREETVGYRSIRDNASLLEIVSEINTDTADRSTLLLMRDGRDKIFGFTSNNNDDRDQLDLVLRMITFISKNQEGLLRSLGIAGNTELVSAIYQLSIQTQKFFKNETGSEIYDALNYEKKLKDKEEV